MRAASWFLALLLAAGIAAAAQSERRWPAYDGRDWAQFAPREKRAYVAGFLAGAAYAPLPAPGAARAEPDTAAVRRIVDSLYRSSALRFPFGHMVYANQLDEFYWWDNHVPVPIYLALWSINQRLLGGAGSGRTQHDP